MGNRSNDPISIFPGELPSGIYLGSINLANAFQVVEKIITTKFDRDVHLALNVTFSKTSVSEFEACLSLDSVNHPPRVIRASRNVDEALKNAILTLLERIYGPKDSSSE